MQDPAKPGRRKKGIITCCLVLSWILSVTFLTLYLLAISSDPAAKLEECQSELQNWTASAEATLAAFQRRMRAMEEKETAARAESHGLRTQLLAANRSLLQAQGHWESCQDQLKTLEQNLTAQVAEVMQAETQKRQAATAELQRQLADKTQALKNAQQQSQREREECKTQIQEMERKQNKLSDSTSSGGGTLGGPAPACLLVTHLALFFLL